MTLPPDLLQHWRLTPGETARALEAELAREMRPGHALHGLALEAVAARNANDDVLFRHRGEADRYSVVHLTWIGKQERTIDFPGIEFEGTLEEFIAQERRGAP